MALTDSERQSFENQVNILVGACGKKLVALGLTHIDIRVIDRRNGQPLSMDQLVQMANGTLPDPTPSMSLSHPEGVKEIEPDV